MPSPEGNKGHWDKERGQAWRWKCGLCGAVKSLTYRENNECYYCSACKQELNDWEKEKEYYGMGVYVDKKSGEKRFMHFTPENVEKRRKKMAEEGKNYNGQPIDNRGKTLKVGRLSRREQRDLKKLRRHKK